MHDTLLDIVIASNDAPAETEFNMADAFIVKISIYRHLSCEPVLDARLLELAQFVVALALEEVEQVFVLWAHLPLDLSEKEDRVVRLVKQVLDLREAEIHLVLAELAVQLCHLLEVPPALV